MTSKFLKGQIETLKKYNIIYGSIDIELNWNEKENKLKKKPIGMPLYKDKKLVSHFDETKNGLIIPLGECYDCLIGVDVDNKNNTVEFFNDLAMNNDYDLNTLTIKTINNGFHYYFKLNKRQREGLKDFMASTAKIFSNDKNQRNIDVKYNNQIFFGPSLLIHNDKKYKYEIDIDTDPDILPDYLYNEILRIHRTQNKEDTKPKKLVIQNKDEPKKEIYIDRDKIHRLKLYLDCLKQERFDNRDDWLSIGAIIYNECHSFDLFEEYSKKSEKYDHCGCKKLWNSFSENRNKKATIKKLIEIAEIDSEINKQKYIEACINDKVGIIDFLYSNGPSDAYMAYLFYNVNKNEFIYDSINKMWYVLNQYGIYINDKDGDKIKGDMNVSLISALKKEYIRLLNIISEDNDPKKRSDLFKMYKSLIKYCTLTKNKENILKELRLLYTAQNIFEKLDNINPYLIGFDNGVYDLENNVFRIAKPEEFISTTTGYNYKKADPKLKKEAMEIFKTIFSDEDELKYVLKHISLGLIGSNSQEKMYVWIGSGGNGKGVIRDIVQVVLGNYYDSMDISYLYKNNIIKADAPNPVMARKKNSRFVISTEPEGDVILKSSTIKSLSGNDPVQTRMLYGDTFNYIPKFKLVIQTNNEPNFHLFDGGMRRRLVMIRFPNKFVENPKLPHERKIDTNLKKKIITDKQYINEFFEILVDHYNLYLKEGLNLPKRFEEDTHRCIKNNLPIEEWLESNVNITNNKKDCVKSSELYDDFINFMDNDTRGITTLLFKNTLISMGIQHKKKNVGQFYTGVKLNN